jgi:hypothetical protein
MKSGGGPTERAYMGASRGQGKPKEVAMTKPKSSGIRVNRTAFMGWVEGDLLNVKNGKGYCNDHIDHERAEKALERGETVELTDNEGRTITRMVPKETGYYEEEVVHAKPAR